MAQEAGELAARRVFLRSLLVSAQVPSVSLRSVIGQLRIEYSKRDAEDRVKGVSENIPPHHQSKKSERGSARKSSKAARALLTHQQADGGVTIQGRKRQQVKG